MFPTTSAAYKLIQVVISSEKEYVYRTVMCMIYQMYSEILSVTLFKFSLKCAVFTD
jgi:hypothetical protein